MKIAGVITRTGGDKQRGFHITLIEPSGYHATVTSWHPIAANVGDGVMVEAHFNPEPRWSTQLVLDSIHHAQKEA